MRQLQRRADDHEQRVVRGEELGKERQREYEEARGERRVMEEEAAERRRREAKDAEQQWREALGRAVQRVDDSIEREVGQLRGSMADAAQRYAAEEFHDFASHAAGLQLVEEEFVNLSDDGRRPRPGDRGKQDRRWIWVRPRDPYGQPPPSSPRTLTCVFWGKWFPLR